MSHGLDLKRYGAPLEVHAAIDPSGLRRRVARHRESAVVLVVFQNADLQVVQFAPHRFRTHRMSERLEPVAHVLHTAIRHETDGDMGSDAPACPMKDRSDPQIVLVGAKSAFDVPPKSCTCNAFNSRRITSAVYLMTQQARNERHIARWQCAPASFQCAGSSNHACWCENTLERRR